MKKNLLVICDDAELEKFLRDSLEPAYRLEIVKKLKTAQEHLAQKTPAAVLIDFELSEQDGLKVLKGLKTTAPIIMLSSYNNIPLAVSATRLGAAEFLRKPLALSQLKAALEKLTARLVRALVWPEEISYLNQPGSQLVETVRAASANNADVFLAGELGTPKAGVAELLHLNGQRSNRRLAKLDLKAFRSESLEATFWAAVKKFISLPAGQAAQQEGELCGTLFLENFFLLDKGFQHTLFNYFKERPGEIDQQVRVVFDVDQEAGLVLPPLRERREGISAWLPVLLKKFSQKHNKQVTSISAAALEFLFTYDFPGNDLELEELIELAVLLTRSDKIELANFPFSPNNLVNTALKRAPENLAAGTAGFERQMLEILLAKTGGNRALLASFLNLPKAALAERLEHLLN